MRSFVVALRTASSPAKERVKELSQRRFVIPGWRVAPDPEPMNTNFANFAQALQHDSRWSVFMGSGFAATQRPGMTMS